MGKQDTKWQRTKKQKDILRLLLVAAGVFLICVVGLHRERQELYQKTAPGAYVQAAVVYVIDGDTIIVRRDGTEAEERGRLIGMDCEESALRDGFLNTEKGQEAALFTRSLLPEGTVVYLQKDISETDRYGRLLRYVWLKLPDNPLDEKELQFLDSQSKIGYNIIYQRSGQKADINGKYKVNSDKRLHRADD